MCLFAISSASSLSAVLTSNLPLGYNVRSAAPVNVHTIRDCTPTSNPLSMIFAATCSMSMDVIPSGTICQEALFPHNSIAKPSLIVPPQISGLVGGPEGGPLGGPEGGPLGGPDGGPDGGPLGGPDGGPEGGPDGGPEGGPLGGPDGGPLGGPDGGPEGGPLGGPAGGPAGPGGNGGGVDSVCTTGSGSGTGSGTASSTGCCGGVSGASGVCVNTSDAGCSGWLLTKGVESSGSAAGVESNGSDAGGDARGSAVFFCSQGGVLGPSSSTVLNVPALILVAPPSAFSPKNVDICTCVGSINSRS